MNVLLYYIEPKLDNTIIIILSTQSAHWPALSLAGPDPFRYCTSAPRKGLGVILYLSRGGFLTQEMLALSGTQRHVGGPLCTNKLQKDGMFCGLPKPNNQTACFGHIFPGWCYLYMAKSYIASYQKQKYIYILAEKQT